MSLGEFRPVTSQYEPHTSWSEAPWESPLPWRVLRRDTLEADAQEDDLIVGMSGGKMLQMVRNVAECKKKRKENEQFMTLFDKRLKF